jgi:hypothetical protein
MPLGIALQPTTTTTRAMHCLSEKCCEERARTRSWQGVVARGREKRETVVGEVGQGEEGVLAQVIVR